MGTLRRISDGAGDSGIVSQAIEWNEDRTFKQVVSNKPVVGCSFLVGSLTARSFSHQDYWLTTVVTEILEETNEFVRFKTTNSEYIFTF